MQNVVLRISKNNTHAGTVTIGADNIIHYSDSTSEDLTYTILSALREGIPLKSDIHNDNLVVSVQKMIHARHPFFPLACISFLEVNGYAVERRYPEVETEIAELLKIFPDSDEHKKYILKHLDTMSYLEQSAVLEEL